MADIAERLASARINGQQVVFQQNEVPTSPVEAYQLQTQVLRLLGAPSEAWKVGSTSPEAQAKLGTDQPGAARIPEKFRYFSGASIPVFDTHDLWVEGEFAFRLGKDLPAKHSKYSIGEVIDAIEAVAPALEIVGSRINGGLSASGRFPITADCGANVALITGDWQGNWQDFDLPNHAVHIRKNGQLVAEGLGSSAMGNPLLVMQWIANHARMKDGLKQGEVVSTGTCTGLTRVVPGDLLLGDFGPVGTVTANLFQDVIVSK